MAELEAVESGGKVTLRLLGKDWASYFESREPCCLPPRVQPPLEEREGWDRGRMLGRAMCGLCFVDTGARET